MIEVRKGVDRYQADYGWLKTKYSFSFGEYRDMNRVRFRSLRVLNDDWIAPKTGFPSHPHQNMEIITYVTSGQLKHQDSQGSEGILGPGGIQRMSAGTGIIHSEENPSEIPLTLFQTWILPREHGLEPSYEDSHIDKIPGDSQFKVIASSEPIEGALTIQQDALMAISKLERDSIFRREIDPSKGFYIHLIDGDLMVNDAVLEPGDAAVGEDESVYLLRSHNGSHALIFELS